MKPCFGEEKRRSPEGVLISYETHLKGTYRRFPASYSGTLNQRFRFLERRREMIGTITRDELTTKINRGDHFLLVETLPESLYEQGHLPGAINLPPNRVAE